jgi:hypothetical protein
MLQAGLNHYVALPVIKIRWVFIGKLMLQAGLYHYVALPVIKIRWIVIGKLMLQAGPNMSCHTTSM